MNSKNGESIIYLTVNDLYNINEDVNNGIVFVRDHHLLQSAVRRPAIRIFGEEQFPTLLDKAAALMHSLAYHHLFADGNKRTALRAVEQFLQANGAVVVWEADEAADFVLSVARGEQEIGEISDWLADHIRR